jgi:formate hydrogenlyase subunit 3/multisubunit Na+/H+ antiporter MnhD subunit
MLAAVFALPLAGALAAAVTPRMAWALAVGTCWANAALAVALFGMIDARTELGGHPVPLGIALRLDGLAWPFLALTAALFALAASATTGRAFLARPGVAALWLMLLAGLNALFVSADAFNLYITLEVVSLAAVALTALGGPAAGAPALRYLFVGLAGSVLYLTGVAFFYRATGALDIQLVGAAGLSGPALAVPLAVATLGLLMKAGVVPFHFWLPPAHAAAAPAASALLSGIVVKGSLYVLLRLWTEIAPPEALQAASPAFRVLGLIALGVGAFGAFRAVRLKALIASSTVAQIGYVPLALGFAAAQPMALKAAVAFMLAHGLAKGAIFLAADGLRRANGHDRLADLTDPGPRLGPTKGAVALAIIALMGLPPSGGFLAKWTLAEAALLQGHWWVAPVMAAAAVLSGLYMLRLGSALMRTPVCAEGDAPRGWSALALAVAAVAVGFSGPLLSLLLLGEGVA